jgi:DNA mismatch endonuclease, patch repair protein
MVDIVSSKKRSEMMSGIGAKDTKPELLVRSLLHKMGYRFRLHRKDILGKPDIVLFKWLTLIFVNGCYWHGHINCNLFRLPKSRIQFWTTKIQGNRDRDNRHYFSLNKEGWKIIVVWECAIVRSKRLTRENLSTALSSALHSNKKFIEIRGDLIVK